MLKLSDWHSSTKWTKEVDFVSGKPKKRRNSPAGASRSKSLNRAYQGRRNRKRKKSSAAGLDPRLLVQALHLDPSGRNALKSAARRLVRRSAEILKHPDTASIAALAGGISLLLGARREVPPALVEPRETRVSPPVPPHPYETGGGPLLPPPPVLAQRGAPPTVPAGHRFQSTVPPLLQAALLDSLQSD